MHINSISSSSFGAKLSPELQSKMIVLGKYLRRTGRPDEYEELKHHASIIRETFPNETIKVKPFTQLGIIYDMEHNPVYQVPVTSYNIYLERFGENDVALLREPKHSPVFKLELQDVRSMGKRLASLAERISVLDRHPQYSKEVTQKIINDLL